MKRTNQVAALACILSTALLCVGHLPAKPPAAPAKLSLEMFQAKVYNSPNGFKLLYRRLDVQKPEAGKKYPLVLFLHGAGGRGSDNKRQLTDAGFCPKLLNKVGFLKRYPCFMIAPQVPRSKRWVEVHWGQDEHTMPEKPGEQMGMALELVDKSVKEYPIDTNRIYVTGLSMGGFGTWDAIQRRPGFFAAAVPICGGGDTAQAAKLTKLPLWVWHGDRDRVVKTKRSRDMVAAVRKAGGQPKYTEQPKTGHGVWPAAYGNREVWDWMFAQAKGKSAAGGGGKVVFADSFDGKLGEGWTWLRENPKTWRIREGGLEIHVEPGVAGNVKNALLRTAPDRKGGKFAVEVTITSHTRPIQQYEQAGITWYHNGRPVFKLVKELINGKLYIIPGRKPMESRTVRLRLIVTSNSWTAQYQPDAKGEFLTAARGRLPAPGKDQVSIQCYNGPPKAEHWIRFDDFRITKLAD